MQKKSARQKHLDSKDVFFLDSCKKITGTTKTLGFMQKEIGTAKTFGFMQKEIGTTKTFG